MAPVLRAGAAVCRRLARQPSAAPAVLLLLADHLPGHRGVRTDASDDATSRAAPRSAAWRAAAEREAQSSSCAAAVLCRCEAAASGKTARRSVVAGRGGDDGAGAKLDAIR